MFYQNSIKLAFAAAKFEFAENYNRQKHIICS